MISPITEILEEIKVGRPVIIIDDENRENEGDIIIAAEKITADLVNFMATHARGLICLTLTEEYCKKLNLPLMVDKGLTLGSTKFTLSIDAKHGITTGISASDRAHTIRVAVCDNSTPQDLLQPGHIFPLMSQAGGVLTRPGHTEAGCDLARLAGLKPSSVIVEVLNENGTMSRRNDLEKFCVVHNIKLSSIENLISYRIENEKYITRQGCRTLKNKYGEFQLVSYLDNITNEAHFALVKGKITADEEILVRVHMENTLTDIMKEDNSKHLSLDDFFSILSKGKNGILVLLRKQSTNSILEKAINKEVHHKMLVDDDKTYGIGAQILSDLGARKIKILGSIRPFNAIKGFGLEVVDYIKK